jgi:hypothetical protein
MARKIVWFLSVVLLLGTGTLGIYNWFNDSPGVTGLQKSVSGAVLIYGVLGVIAGTGLIARRPWSVWIAAAWGVACTYAAGVATYAYSPPTAARTGVIFAGLATAAIAVAVVWGTRHATSAPPTTTSAGS